MIRINLLPVREERRRAGIRQVVVILGASVIGSLLVVVAFHMKVRSDVTGAQELLAETQRQIDSYQGQLERVERFRADKEQIERKLDVIERLERSRSGPVRVMDEVATHAPERLWVTRLETKGPSVTLEGLSLDYELVAVFMTALSSSPLFRGVELQETRATEFEGFKLNEFKLSAQITAAEGAASNVAGTAPGTAGAGR